MFWRTVVLLPSKCALLIDTSKQDDDNLNKEMNHMDEVAFQEVDEDSDDGGDDDEQKVASCVCV